MWIMQSKTKYSKLLLYLFFISIIFTCSEIPYDFEVNKTVNFNLKISPLSFSSIEVTWDSINGPHYYKVLRRKADESNFTQSPPIYATNYTDSGLDANTIYYYMVATFDTVAKITSFYSKENKTTTKKITIPSPHSPPNKTKNISTTVYLEWTNIGGITSFDIEIALDIDFSDPNSFTEITDTLVWIKDLTIDKNYYWRVRSGYKNSKSEWSTVWSFQTSNAPAPTQLHSPLNDTNINTTSAVFLWEEVSNIETYHFQLSSDIHFAKIILDTLLADTTITVKSLDSNAVYYWKVQTQNQIGSSAWTKIWWFSTKKSVLSKPSLLSPVNTIKNQPISLPLKWASVPEATSYHLQVSDTKTIPLNIVYEDSAITDTEHLLDSLHMMTTYYWRVRAKNSGGVSDWADPFHFSTNDESPKRPILKTPKHKAKISAKNITLSWEKDNSVDMYYIQISKSKSFKTLVVNDSTKGLAALPIEDLSNKTTYYWRVRAKNSGGVSDWSLIFAFTTLIAHPSIPNLVSPEHNSTLNDTIEFKAATINGAATYHFQISLTSTFSTLFYENYHLKDPKIILNNLTTGTKFYWRFRAKNEGGLSDWSEVWIVRILSQPEKPQLLSPSNGATGQSLSPTLRWSSEVNVIAHHVQVSQTNDFSNLIVDDPTLSQETKKLTSLMKETVYYWRVRVKTEGGSSLWTIPWSFKTGSKIPEMPNLISPKNNTLNAPLNVRLQWSIVSNADTYHIQVSRDSTFSNIIFKKSDITVASQNIPDLFFQSTYFWRVRAKNSFGESNWSSVWMFVTTSTNDSFGEYSTENK